jgi:hypothetical protein
MSSEQVDLVVLRARLSVAGKRSGFGPTRRPRIPDLCGSGKRQESGSPAPGLQTLKARGSGQTQIPPCLFRNPRPHPWVSRETCLRAPAARDEDASPPSLPRRGLHSYGFPFCARRRSPHRALATNTFAAGRQALASRGEGERRKTLPSSRGSSPSKVTSRLPKSGGRLASMGRQMVIGDC